MKIEDRDLQNEIEMLNELWAPEILQMSLEEEEEEEEEEAKLAFMEDYLDIESDLEILMVSHPCRGYSKINKPLKNIA